MAFPEMKFGDLSVKLPIIQGGMGIGVSMSGLAAAVAEEGGIGVIAGAMIGMREADIGSNPMEATARALRRELRKARRATRGVIGVNAMAALTTFAQVAKTAMEEGADVIFSGAGLPMELPGIYRRTCDEMNRRLPTRLAPIVSSARAAALIARKWVQKYGYAPDAFVVEGPLAGGHLGFARENLDRAEYRLEILLPGVLEAVKHYEDRCGRRIPVIAAGGIYSGADIGRFLDLGAAGVQMGTRFVATHECDASECFKQAYVDATREDVIIIDSPLGMPGRALRNAFIDSVRSGGKKAFHCPFHCIHSCEREHTSFCMSSALIMAMRGHVERGVTFCGENVFKIDAVLSVRELVQTLRFDYGEWLRQKRPDPVLV